MRWLLTGLLLLVFGALSALALSWPEGGGGGPRYGVSLSEFQRGARIDRVRPPDPQTVPDSRRPAQPAGKLAVADIAAPAPVHMAATIPPATALPATAAGANANHQRHDEWAVQAAAPGHRMAPAADKRQAAGPSPLAPLPLPVLATAPNSPETGSGATARQQPPDEDATDLAAPPSGLAQGQSSEVTPIGFALRPLAMVRHTERISIHYHDDERSRLIGRRVLGKLESAGLGAGMVPVHSKAHASPSPTVRYFSQADAPVAVSLARMLATRKTVWRVEDCTACKRKPEAGSVQIWLAAAEPPAK